MQADSAWACFPRKAVLMLQQLSTTRLPTPQKEMIMANLESTLTVSQTESLPTKNRTFDKAAIVLVPTAMLAALLLCITTQGAPAIDLSVLVAP
jgi:hypothetical protein